MNPHNHDVAPDESALVNVNFNGQWVKVPAKLNVVEVTKRMDDFLPHYCYHPKLNVVGNCRMCLFEMGTPKTDAERKPVLGPDGMPEINWMPRPQIGCATQVTEGMGIRTHSPLAEECRKGVMEFLLINHPLDCPICDQAGECKLQEYSVEYGNGTSRFIENKVTKPKNVDIGERIVLDDERCILCSRCVRFAQEVVKDDVLGFVNRGSYNTLTVHPGKRFDNDYSLNTVDICPVGALTSKDFRFKMRVWFLKETESICTSCGTGCNVTIGSREGVVYRLTPRENEHVNSHWMCDQGRLNFHDLHDEKRITHHQSRVGSALFPTSLQDASSQIASKLKTFQPCQIAILASARMTNEELHLTQIISKQLQANLTDVVPRQWRGDTFLKSNDQNPNTMGAERSGISHKGEKHKEIATGVQTGKIKALLCLQEDPSLIGLNEKDLSQLELLVTLSILPNTATAQAHYVLAGAGFAEKSGTMLNVHGRLQKLNQACRPPGSAAQDWEILAAIAKQLGVQEVPSTIEESFTAFTTQTLKLPQLRFATLGTQGIPLETETASSK